MGIEALAKKAGMVTEWNAGAASCVWTYGCAGVSAEELKAFAALVAEEEREACANVCEANASTCGEESIMRLILETNAAAIRARSNVVVEADSRGLMREVAPRTEG